VTLAHWDTVERRRRDHGRIAGLWTYLGEAAGSVGVGVRRIELEPGKASTPAHVHVDGEEIFFVLAGSGLSWQDGVTYAIRAGDCLVHPAGGAAHTLRAGGEGLDVLAFGPRPRPGATLLPNQQTAWLGPTWVEPVGAGEHPFAREPELEWPDASARPPAIVNAEEVAGEEDDRGAWKPLARSAGAVRSGLNWCHLRAGQEGAPPHAHSAEEELFVVLDGEGVLELWAPPDPAQPRQTAPRETHELRRGHVVSRPPGTRVPHTLRAAAAAPLTYLAYGTRDPNDVCYYPRSNKVFLRGVGLIARLEPLEYGDGEPG
jgi:uncharacterized cupin superfamily protein